MKLTRLTQPNSERQGQDWHDRLHNTAIYECGDYLIHASGPGDWSIHKGGSYTKTEHFGGAYWDIDLHLHGAECVFPDPWKGDPMTAKLSDCREWLKNNITI